MLRNRLVLMVLVGLFLAAYPFSLAGQAIESFPTPGPCPTGLAWDGNYLWVADKRSDSLYQVDPSDGLVMRALPSPGPWPVGLAWDGQNLWSADFEEGEVYSIDPEDGLVLGSVSSPGPEPWGLAWDSGHLLVSDAKEKKVYRISPDDGTVISSFDSPGGFVGVTHDGKYLWMSDRARDQVHMATKEEGEIIVSLATPGPWVSDLAWDGEHLWALDYQKDMLYKIEIDREHPHTIGNTRESSVEYTQEFRAYGPGAVRSLDFYLAVPQNSPRQELLGEIGYDPVPDGFLTDKWGQEFAHWSFSELAVPRVITARMRMKVKLSELDYQIFPERVGSLREIPREIQVRYLADGTKYCAKDPLIKKAAEEATKGESNPYWMARRIFRYVIDHLEYKLAGGWEAAPGVLRRGTGSCSEYTFVFIALCRAAGLPARYVGAVGAAGQDASWDRVFHRWAEVYLPGYGWVPVDPSRGDSKSPLARAQAFGHLSNRHLITTRGGGDSEYLGWTYNSAAKWTLEGRCKVQLERIAEQEPLNERSD